MVKLNKKTFGSVKFSIPKNEEKSTISDYELSINAQFFSPISRI